VASDLADLFSTYLTSGHASRPSAELASALEHAGYPLEAAGVSATAGQTVDLPDSAWHGRRLWTGTTVPVAALPGDLWLDTCQLSPMVLVPREDTRDAPYAWIDTRPVHRWQYATFLALAKFAPRPVQLDPPLSLLDPTRIMWGSATDAVVDLTPDEARLCANWFGKAVCGRFAWQMASAFLSETVMSALWSTPAREWAGSVGEGEYVTASSTTIDLDPEAESESESESDCAVFGEWAHSRGITFRTCVYSQLGLHGEPGDDGAWYLPRRLVSRAPRGGQLRGGVSTTCK
jgi:hypothetical protein